MRIKRGSNASKYDKETISWVLDLVKKGISQYKISKKTGIHKETILYWTRNYLSESEKEMMNKNKKKKIKKLTIRDF